MITRLPCGKNGQNAKEAFIEESQSSNFLGKREHYPMLSRSKLLPSKS